MAQRRIPFAGSSTVVLIAVALALLAAPAAMGAKPIRTVLGPSSPSALPAGFGCAFDVVFQPSADARRTVTEFDDGRVMTNTNANPIISNPASGLSFLHRARYHAIDTYDPAANDITSVIDGHVVVVLWPGDQGPFGEVDYPGLLLRFTGNTRIVFDLDSEVVTEFSYYGRFTDVCSALTA